MVPFIEEIRHPILQRSINRSTIQLEKGQLYSELLFTGNNGLSVTVVAKSDLECYVLRKEDMDELIFKFPNLAELLISVIDIHQSQKEIDQ